MYTPYNIIFDNDRVYIKVLDVDGSQDRLILLDNFSSSALINLIYLIESSSISDLKEFL